MFPHEKISIVRVDIIKIVMSSRESAAPGTEPQGVIYNGICWEAA